MNLKGILKRNQGLTIAGFQELQREYDEKFVDTKFTGLPKVEHTYAHMGKLVGRLAEYIEALEEKREVSAEDIKSKVIPDLLVYSAWLAEEFGVDIEQAYLTRFMGNLKRLHSEEIPKKEFEELEGYIKEKFQ